MNLPRFFLQIVTILFPHILYRVVGDFIENIEYHNISILGYNINIDYDFMKKMCIFYPLLPIILFYMFNYHILYLYVQIYYFIITYLIIIVGDNSRYILMGISLSLFMSEFWEIPIYIHQYGVSLVPLFSLDSILSMLVIVSKLSMIIYFVSILKELGYIKYKKIFIETLYYGAGNYLLMMYMYSQKFPFEPYSFFIRFMLFLGFYKHVIMFRITKHKS